jgi:cyclomaltodextrinase / maltogenic alpha-amylase / neopullulanase
MIETEPRQAPAWVRHAVWWHVYPIGFLGADPAGASRQRGRPLDGMCQWLDYAVALGTSGLALGPIFQSSSHGYDTIDHFMIDDRLGGDEAFDRLVAGCRERGLRLVLDGVFNHVGRDFPLFQRAVREGPASEAARWFHLTWPDGRNRRDGRDGPSYKSFEGHRGLVVLNHAAPEVQDYIVAVMQHWLARGADGWRLDAAYAVPAGFWSRVLPEVRARHPQAYLAGEVIHGDYRQIIATTGLDSVTQYELWKAVWSSLNDRNFHELAWALRRHNDFQQSFRPLTFAGNHDVTRIASKLDDDRHLALALVVLFTVGGTPSIYAGDEQAFRGIKEDRPGGDDEVRPAFPPGPEGLAPYGWPVYRLHQQLIGFRRRHPWLHDATTTVLSLSSRVLTYRPAARDHAIVVALNVDDQPHTVPLDAPLGNRLHASSPPADPAVLEVPSHGWEVAF